MRNRLDPSAQPESARLKRLFPRLPFPLFSIYNKLTLNENYISLATCPACSSPDISSFKKGTIDASGLDEHQIMITDSQYGKYWDMSICRVCGHVFANPCPRPEFLFQLYSRVEDPLYSAEAGGRAKNFVRILECLGKAMPERGRLFDVGAATGILLDEARNRGWETGGIEPSGWAVKAARARYGITLFQGAFEYAQLETDSWDAVTMIDIIEHTPLPFEALSKARDILRPSGVLCLVTPDIHSLAARLAGKRWWHYRPGHLAFFSRRSLDAILKRVGFKAFMKRKYAWTFSVHYLLSRLPSLARLLKDSRPASILKRIPIKLALGDSFEIYARKDARG